MAQPRRTIRYDRIIIAAVALIAIIICIVAFANGIKNGANDKGSSAINTDTITTTIDTAAITSTTVNNNVDDTTINTGDVTTAPVVSDTATTTTTIQ